MSNVIVCGITSGTAKVGGIKTKLRTKNFGSNVIRLKAETKKLRLRLKRS